MTRSAWRDCQGLVPAPGDFPGCGDCPRVLAIVPETTHSQPASIFASAANNPQRGAILLLLMVMVVILGLASGLAGQSWRSTMQREREAELLWRGQQYQRAFASYYAVKHGAQQMLPTKLEHLLSDPRFPNAVRHLRRLYNDPMTGKDWELITDPAERIIGVRSSSELQPFRQDGFPKALEKLQGKNSYREWEFVYEPPRTAASARRAPAARAPQR